MKSYTIGIDPGRNTGFAVYNRAAKFLPVVETITFWGVFDAMENYPPDEVHAIVIEVPNARTVYHKGARSRGAIESTAVRVGEVIREAILLAEGLRRQGYAVLEITPRGKINAAAFKRITGHEGRTNSHTRDAGMLCWGK